MSTIAQELALLNNTKHDISNVLADAGIEVPHAFADYADVISANIGVPSADVPDVEFIDYDGKTLHKYTFEEANALTALPDYPAEISGATSGYTLVNEGWNYSLAEVQRHAQAGIKTIVGCTYRTSDGATRIHIHIDDPNDREFGFSMAQASSNSTGIEWGDPNDTSDDLTSVGTLTARLRTHTYSTTGDFFVRIYPHTSGAKTLRFQRSLVDYNLKYAKKIKGVEFGYLSQFYGLSNGGGGVLAFCENIEHVSIPSAITEPIGTAAFMNATKLKSLVIPKSTSNYVLKLQAFDDCASLEKVSIPPCITQIGTTISVAESTFKNCSSLKYVSIPDTVTQLGKNSFDSCASIKNVYWNGTPGMHGNSFNRNTALEEITLAPASGASFHEVGGSDFYGCSRLKRVTCSVPIKATGEACFQSCINLESVPEVYMVTKNMFNDCPSLRNVKATYKSSSVTLPFSFIAGKAINGYYSFTIDTNVTLTGGGASGTVYDPTHYYVADFTATDNVYVIYNGSSSSGTPVLSINANDGIIEVLNQSYMDAAIATTTDKIGDTAFRYSGLIELDLSDCTVIPVLGSTVFGSVPADYKIIVPTDQGPLWQSATGWTAVSSHIVEA